MRHPFRFRWCYRLAVLVSLFELEGFGLVVSCCKGAVEACYIMLYN